MKTRMQSCEEVTELFSLHLDEELDELGRSRMNRHIAQCTSCAELFAELCTLDTFLQETPAMEAPQHFTEQAVAAAFDDNLRQNLWYGLLTLLLGTTVIGSLFLLGRVDLFWMVLSMLVAPEFLSGAWIGEAMAALAVTGRVMLTVLSVLRELLVGPLLLPALLSLLSTAFLALILRRQDQSGTMTPA